MKGSCSSSAARTRRSSAPTPTSPTRSRAACGAGSRTPARPARGSSAPTWSSRSPTPSSTGSGARPSGSRSATRSTGRPRSGRWSPPTQADLVTELVDDALAGGADRLTGGPREVPGFDGQFIAPTVLAGVTDEMRIMREEIFGPVVPVIVVADEDEALERANDSNFGLGASVWTTRPRQGRADRAADRVGDGLDQRPLLLPRRAASARGAGSRTPASAARTRSSASTSA